MYGTQQGSDWTDGASVRSAPEQASSAPDRRRTIQRVLIPLDGSTVAEAALPHVIAVARAFKAQVYLLSVIEPAPDSPSATDSSEWRLTRARTRVYLDGIAKRLAQQGIEAERAITEGSASEQILRFAEHQRIDLVVLCSHGKGGLTDFSLSGTVSKVLLRVRSSVLIVRAHAAAPGEPVAHYERILVPVDCSKTSQWVAHVAGAIAAAHGSELLLATVITRPETLGSTHARGRAAPLADQLEQLNREAARRFLAWLARDVRRPDIAVRERILQAQHVGQTLATLAERENCALIVLSADGANRDPGLPFGSVPSLLLEHGNVAVLVLQGLRLPAQPRIPAPVIAATTVPTHQS